MSDPLAFTSAKVQRLRRLLAQRRARREERAVVVEGAGLVAEAARAGWTIEEVFLGHGTVPESLGLTREVQESGATVHELAPGVLERVATTETPQPVLAVLRLRESTIPSDATFLLVGDRINDPGNAGTMIRSAEAAGVDAVAFTAGSVDPFNPKVIRASAGALFHVPVLSDVSLAEARVGHVVGTTSHAGIPYLDVDFTRPTTIVVGNEASGLDHDAPVDEWITIPHAGRAESLNVAMATTLLAFEVARQRRCR